jgi:hypothetical protein
MNAGGVNAKGSALLEYPTRWEVRQATRNRVPDARAEKKEKEKEDVSSNQWQCIATGMRFEEASEA